MKELIDKYLTEAAVAGKPERSNKLFIKWMKAAAGNIEDCMELAKKEKRGEYSRLREIYSDMAKLLSDITK